jgi:hypothetical protein
VFQNLNASSCKLSTKVFERNFLRLVFVSNSGLATWNFVNHGLCWCPKFSLGQHLPDNKNGEYLYVSVSALWGGDDVPSRQLLSGLMKIKRYSYKTATVKFQKLNEVLTYKRHQITTFSMFWAGISDDPYKVYCRARQLDIWAKFDPRWNPAESRAFKQAVQYLTVSHFKSNKTRKMRGNYKIYKGECFNRLRQTAIWNVSPRSL